MILHLDFETRSTVDLKAAGLDNYARHPDTDVWCCAYAFGDKEPDLLTPENFCEAWFHFDGAETFIAHNARFEMAIWQHIMVPRYGWPAIPVEQWRCTMAMAYAMSLPGSLENAAAAVGIQQQKDMAGHRLMMQMARPKGYRCPSSHVCREKLQATERCGLCHAKCEPVWWDDEDKKQKLYEYCKQDVRVEQELYKRLRPLSTAEQKLWGVDYAINHRGLYLDRPAITAAVEIVGVEQNRLSVELRRLTENVVTSPTEVAGLTRWVQGQGVVVPGLAKADLVSLLADESLPPGVRRALEIRQEGAKTSTAKLVAMLEACSADGRIKDTMQYHGAGTGRWAGRRLQPHNMPRPSLTQPEIESVLDLLPILPPDKMIRMMELLYGNPMTVVSDCLRGMICAAPGHDLLAGDFANIEGRVLAWLAGESWKVEAFKQFDEGTGHDLYLLAASRIYRRPVQGYTKKSPERQIGKVAELALGYQGGVGAFQQMARGYGVRLSDSEADAIKAAWREAHPHIEQYWYDLERAAIEAVRNAGTQTQVRNIKFRVRGSFLFCLLPSDRVMCYPYPSLKERETPWGEMREQIHYKTVDGQSNKWVETHTYGGSICENITQAVARDILADAIIRVEAASYPVVLHVHDEIVAEVPQGAGDLGQFEKIMAENPAWASGLPIAVEGWRGKRYRK